MVHQVDLLQPIQVDIGDEGITPTTLAHEVPEDEDTWLRQLYEGGRLDADNIPGEPAYRRGNMAGRGDDTKGGGYF